MAMRLDKLIHRHVNNIEKELDFSGVSDEELEELEALYKKAGSIWNGTEFLKPDFRILSEEEQLWVHEICNNVKIKPVLIKR